MTLLLLYSLEPPPEGNGLALSDKGHTASRSSVARGAGPFSRLAHVTRTDHNRLSCSRSRT